MTEEETGMIEEKSGNPELNNKMNFFLGSRNEKPRTKNFSEKTLHLKIFKIRKY